MLRLQLQLRKTNKKQRGEHLFKGNGAKTGTCKYSFKSSAINGRGKGSKKRETADAQIEKGEKKMIG